MAITQEKNIEMLEKLADGNFKIKYPKTKKEQVIGIENVLNYGIATQAEAQAGTSNVKYMTPLRTKEAVLANSSLILSGQLLNQNIGTIAASSVKLIQINTGKNLKGAKLRIIATENANAQAGVVLVDIDDVLAITKCLTGYSSNAFRIKLQAKSVVTYNASTGILTQMSTNFATWGSSYLYLLNVIISGQYINLYFYNMNTSSITTGTINVYWEGIE